METFQNVQVNLTVNKVQDITAKLSNSSGKRSIYDVGEIRDYVFKVRRECEYSSFLIKVGNGIELNNFANLKGYTAAKRSVFIADSKDKPGRH